MSTEQKPGYPWRKLHKDQGGFEKYLLRLPELEKPFIDHDNPPSQFTSIGIDNYLNWFSALTAYRGVEHASWVYLQLDPRHLIFPSKPVVGTENYVRTRPKRHLPRFASLIRAHSHRDDSCFSMHDLARFMFHEKAAFEALGTRDANYLLLRTEQTTQDNLENVHNKVEEMNKLIKGTAEEYYSQILSIHPDEIPIEDRDLARACLVLEGRERFGRDPYTHLITFNSTCKVAEVYKLGFYFSWKDGVYHRFTNEDLKRIDDQVQEVMIQGFALYLSLKNDPQSVGHYQRLKSILGNLRTDTNHLSP